MKELLAGAALCLCLLLTLSARPRAQAPEPVIAFVNVTVIPMDRETVLADQTAFIRGSA